MVKSAFQLDEDRQIQKIKAQEAKVAALAALSDSAVLNQLRDLERPISRIADQAAIYEKNLEAFRYREVLDWLSPVPYKLHHKSHSEKRLQGTAEWLLNSSDYLQWKTSSTSSILLVHGSAGSGKMTLVSAVVDSLINDAALQTSPAPLAYFYCARNAFEPPRSDSAEILRSIIRQLSTDSVRKTAHTQVMTDFERREKEAKGDGFDIQRLSTSDCIGLIVDIATPNPATIVIDAVEEVQQSHRHELLDGLKRISREAGSVVNLLLTSRDDDQILPFLQSASKIRIEPRSNQADVEKFVRNRPSLAIESCALLGGSVANDLQADLIQALLASAGER